MSTPTYAEARAAIGSASTPVPQPSSTTDTPSGRSLAMTSSTIRLISSDVVVAGLVLATTGSSLACHRVVEISHRVGRHERIVRSAHAAGGQGAQRRMSARSRCASACASTRGTPGGGSV